MDTRIQLDLSKHCIETEIKRIYNSAISAYFKENADKKQVENIIEMAIYALEHFDFLRLRSQYPSLAGKTNDPVCLMVDKNAYRISIGDDVLSPIVHGSAETTEEEDFHKNH